MPVCGPARSQDGQAYLSKQVKTRRHRVAGPDEDPIPTRNVAPWRPDGMTSAEGGDGSRMTGHATRRSGGPSIRVGAGVFMGLPPARGRLPEQPPGSSVLSPVMALNRTGRLPGAPVVSH
jgi:hypothetical protein